MNQKVSYVEFERRILVNLVRKYRDIIENKKTDSSTVYKKQQTWLKITSEYNRHSNVQKRLTKQLKRLWENTKARAKKDNRSSFLIQPTSSSRENTEETMDNTQTSSSTSGIDVAGFDQIFGQTDTALMADLKSDSEARRTRKRRSETTNGSNFISEDNYDQFLSPIISARIKKIEESTIQQKELHNFSLQREQLQSRTLQEQINRQAELHSLKMDREREFYNLRIKHEKELHLQRIRNDQELHQLKLSEYNKVQTTTYPLLYKQ